MFPLLLPWEFSADVLAVLLYVTAAVVAGVAAWVVYTRGDDTPMGTYGMPAITFFGVLALGIWIVAEKVLPVKAQPLPLHTYGLMIALGFVSAIHVAGRECDRQIAALGLSEEEGAKRGMVTRKAFFDLAFYILIWSMVGSRVLFIIVNWSGPNGYGAHPENIFKVWTGGLVFFGGFIGALLASVWWARKHKVNFRALADIAIPTVALGHFFGRMGCIAAGCCWGKVCKDSGYLFGLEYPEGALAYSDMVKSEAHRAFILEHGHTPAVHPTPLYEGGGELLIFLFLTWYRPKKRFHGQVLAMWLVIYSILRLTIETFRGDWGRGMLFKFPAENPLLLSTSQTIGIAMLVLGVTLFFLWRPKELPRTDGGDPEAAPAAA